MVRPLERPLGVAFEAELHQQAGSRSGSPQTRGWRPGGPSMRRCHLHGAVSRGGHKRQALHLQLGPRAADPAATTSAGAPWMPQGRAQPQARTYPLPTCPHRRSAPQRTSRSLQPPSEGHFYRLRQESGEALSAPLPVPCGPSCVRLGSGAEALGKLLHLRVRGLPAPRGPANSISSPRRRLV